MIRRLIALAVILGPPALVAWSLCRAAADGDCEPGPIDDDICDECDWPLDIAGVCWGCGCGPWVSP